ncbi:hypothetical protein C9I50_14735 [Pseudomonas prosekii]|uniref:non-ribosomal peptide synthetase n=1 Tax=Pseudomonas prosekii TaxID=1148509 RepID=UPI000D615AB0|nr:non-ribosomal peptide synthetase [Pseudomonas prosekii]PWE40846.1 hypothetical protein C9I50_14735 [Pseudomonas prosekii]
MSVIELLATLKAKDIQLSLKGDQLLVQGNKQALSEPAILASMREHKPALIAMIRSGDYSPSRAGSVEVPANAILPGTTRITPSMLTLATLDQAAIERIVATVPGGAANVQDIYPLAPLQEGILFHHVSAAQGDPYIMQSRFAFDSRERLDDFVHALQGVIDRHDILRTGVVWQGLERPMQVVWRQATLPVEALHLDPANGEIAAQLHQRFDGRRYRIDVTQAPLLRLVHAWDAPSQRIVAMLMFHHMALDHSALEVVSQEMQAFLLGRGERLGDAVPFRTYVAHALLGVSEQEHEAFFREMLGDIDEPTLPFGLQDVQGDGHAIEEARREVDAELGRRLRTRARYMGVSAASLFHLAWAQVLAVVSGKQRVVFGTVLMGRMLGADATDRALGIFINTLPFRVDIGGASLHAAVKATHARLTTLLRHEHAPLALAQRCSAVVAPTPLFSALLNYRHSASSAANASAEALAAWRGIAALSSEERTNYPLTLSVDDLGDHFALTALTAPGIDAARICGYLHQALENLVWALEQPADPASTRLAIIPPSERRQLLPGFNDTRRDYPDQLTVHGVFEALVLTQPEAIAVVHGEQILSYRQLNIRANRLAHHLISLGLKPGDHVAILLERSVGLLVSQLAISKCAAAYVPLDIHAPAERQRFMVEDSQAYCVLSPASATLDFPARRIDPEQLPSGEDLPTHNPHIAQSAEALAYIMYTSGSTGTPKGVLVPHRAITRLVLNNGYADFNPQDRVAFASNPAFDASTMDVWGPLLNGGQVLVIDRQTLLEPARFGQVLSDAGATILFVTTALFNQYVQLIPEALRGLRILLCGGERADPAAFRRLLAFAPELRLVHCYGPTETTTYATTYEVKSLAADADSVPIGRPISNTQIYLLDAFQQPVPIGVVSEICIGGQGVAKGYLNRPELTAEKFVPDVFSGNPQALLYRTGDLGRWNAQGLLECLGRNDDQVKIRGFRIELGEIEARLATCPGVKDVVVLAREDVPGDKRLVAYYTVHGAALSGESLRAHLQNSLPDYMIPSACVHLPKLPLNANGKVERKALPAPDHAALLTREYQAPQGEIETVLAQIWAEVLQVEQVGREDHFFELGGHSLLAMRMVSRVRLRLGVELALNELFANPQLSAVAQVLAEAGRSTLPAIMAGADDEGSPLSFAQQRLWFLAQMDGGNSAYNIAASLRLRGRLDVAALQRALARIVERHATLRSRFVEHHDQPQVSIDAAATLHLRVEDWRDQAQSPQALRARIQAEAAQPFDLQHGPLIRGSLLTLADDHHVLLLTLHHIVADGWSMGVLTAELIALYQAFSQGEADPLPALAVQYGDFARWQRRWLSGEVLQRQSEYWQQALAGAPALLLLPTDRPRPAQQDYAGSSVDIRLDEQLTAALKALSQRHGTTLYMTLMAAWAAVLSRLSGQDDVVIGSPAANRQRAEVEGLIGLFVNTLAVRIDTSGELDVAALLARVKTQTLAAQAHQDLPFEQVVEVTRPTRSLAYSPLFQTSLAWHNLENPALTLADLRVEGLAEASHFAKFDVSLSLGEGQGRISGVLEYATALFDQSTAKRFAGYFNRLLQAMVANDQALLAQVDLLDEPEHRQLLVDFNATHRAYPQAQTVHQLFEAQVLLRPEALAAVDGAQPQDYAALSYAALNQRANQLAHHLISLGVAPGDSVAIVLERSLDLLVSQLAVCKCAAVYVPLDLNAPAERQAFMLGDSGAVCLLTRSGLASNLASSGALQRVELDRLTLTGLPTHNPQLPQSSEAVAYIMYTSGSTGTPKGVLVPHRAITRLVLNNGYADFNPQDRVAFASNPAFDASTMDVWGPLLNGGQVLVIDHQTLLEPARFGQVLSDAGATVLFVTTALFNQYVQLIPEALKGLRILLCGGERADPAAFRRLLAFAPELRLVHCYGPTETTTYATTYEVKSLAADADSVPIGRPISNTQIYLLDAFRQPVPIGVVGEICIGGQGVAKGYLNRPELTAEKFVPDLISGNSDALLYRTGDLGRWNAQGLLECIGRNDDQVKIRGFRIELGEIEARLATAKGVKDVVVLAREDAPGDKRLVAYYTADDALDVEYLRTHLQGQLPDYMTPGAYVHLANLPLTANGKVDRKALPAPQPSAMLSRDYAPPIAPLEQNLASLWAEVLTLQRVGRHDNFFELGGHSLLAVRLVNLMQKSGLPVTLAELFQHASIESMATHLSQRSGAAADDEHLIKVRVGGSQPPLFLVHEFSGQDLYFPALGRHIAEGIPVYGLPGLALGQEQLQTMHCLAARLVKIIRSVQPHGPYRLAGWSFGGVLAYEIAAQLLGADETVEFLGLIDTYVPRLADQGKARWSDRHAGKRQLLLLCTQYWTGQGTAGEAALGQLQALEQSLEQLDFDSLLQTCREQQLLYPQIAAAADRDVRHYLEREVGHGHAMAHYSLAPLPVPLHLFVAQERPPALAHLSQTLGWAEVLAPERLQCIGVPGDHQSMMKAPHIAALGQAISAAIEASAAWVKAQPPSRHQPVLPLQNGQPGHAPIFCVPGAGDSVTGFIGLTQALGPQWPIMGLQPRGLDGEAVPHSAVESAAEHYLEALERHYPDGPLHLLGHSFGGWVAYQMAARLQAQGREVASLTLIDSESPGDNGVVGKPYTTTAALQRLIEAMQLASGQSLGIEPAQFADADDVTQLQQLHAGMVRVGLIPARSTAQSIHGLARTFATALRTVYQPRRPYTGAVRLVLADDPTLDAAGNQREQMAMVEGWRQHCRELAVWHGPGNHFTLLKPPHVLQLAAWWRDGLTPPSTARVS